MPHQSSVSVKEFEVGAMLVIDHFTGTLLMSRFEADHLRALLDIFLGDTPAMSAEEAKQIIDERERDLAPFMEGRRP